LANNPDFRTPESIGQRFSHSNLVRNAEISIRNLKTGSASSYNSLFTELSNRINWNDSTLKSQFYHGLKKELAETRSSKGSNNYGPSCLSDESLDNLESFSLSSLDFLSEEHIIIPVSLKDMSNQYVSTFALIDSGATSNFVNESFVFDKSFPLKPLPIPRVLKVVDGRSISSGKVTHSISSEFQIGNK
jgi:hypothetical protein